MTTLREAAQQALEALEYHVEQTRPIHRTTAAITALRAALEQLQQPVAYIAPNGELRKTAEAQDASEWGNKFHPLYAAPPQRKPLTEQEIYEMYNEPRSDAEMVAFARAIERAHGIGGQDES